MSPLNHGPCYNGSRRWHTCNGFVAHGHADRQWNLGESWKTHSSWLMCLVRVVIMGGCDGTCLEPFFKRSSMQWFNQRGLKTPRVWAIGSILKHRQSCRNHTWSVWKWGAISWQQRHFWMEKGKCLRREWRKRRALRKDGRRNGNGKREREREKKIP